jgi:hypothetical protein
MFYAWVGQIPVERRRLVRVIFGMFYVGWSEGWRLVRVERGELLSDHDRAVFTAKHTYQTIFKWPKGTFLVVVMSDVFWDFSQCVLPNFNTKVCFGKVEQYQDTLLMEIDD